MFNKTSKTIKNKQFRYLVMFFISTAIILTLFAFAVLRQSQSDYLRSSETITVNNQLDRLFKDIVYLPLVVDQQKAVLLSQSKTDEINLNITKLENLSSKQVLVDNFIAEIKNKWIELKTAANTEKLNLLYDLELLHNSIDGYVSNLLRQELYVATKKISWLMVLAVISGIIAFLIIILSRQRELADLKLMEFELLKSEETSNSINTFMAIAAHDLRTPLNGIIGISEILRKSHLPPIEETNLADNLYHTGKELLKINNNILEFTGLKSGTIELENAGFSLAAVLQQIVTTFSVEIREKSIGLKYLIDESIPVEIFGDASRLSQILFNLVENAINSTMNGAIILKIIVLAKEKNKLLRLEISVEDSGVGLNEKQFQVLNFAVCNQLVKAMGGNFEAKSIEGNGSVFSFTCSFQAFSDDIIGNNFLEKYHYFDDPNSIKPLFTNNDRPTILIVDDNSANLLMLQIILERMGAKTMTASNGKEAINEFPTNKIDLIIMDCQMPVMNGFEATKILRQNKVIVPILAMSTSNSFNAENQCKLAGMTGSIIKPIDYKILTDIITKFLDYGSDYWSRDTLDNFQRDVGQKGTSRIIHSFLDDLPTTEMAIDQFLTNNDLDAIHKVGHRFKSASENIGAKGLSDLFFMLEKTQDINEAKDLNSQIHLASLNLRSKLDEHLNHLN